MTDAELVALLLTEARLAAKVFDTAAGEVPNADYAAGKAAHAQLRVAVQERLEAEGGVPR